MLSSHTLIEELIAGKQGLGAEFSFEPNTLEVKPNQYGVNGVFTQRALSEGTEVISAPQLNGSLTLLRAYEEAQELLQNLGPDRFNVTEQFVLTCAMYLRCTNTATKHADLLITEPDLKSVYHGSPMTSFGSLDRQLLLDDNNSHAVDIAVKVDKQIKKMNVDPELFRALSAYVTSRTFHDLGIVPVMDWFNSSYGNGANCKFISSKGRLAYILLRDVEAGEELVWNYNNEGAEGTWLNYGYIDYERPTVALLELCVSEEEKVAFENFAIKKLHRSKDEISPSNKIDGCKFSFILSNPDKLPTPALSLTDFIRVRKWFRIFILSGGERNSGSTSTVNMQSDEPIFVLELERKIVACIRIALKNGLIAGRKRVEQFTVSEFGCSVDMAPYIDMMESASAVWEEVLAVVEAICSAQNMGDCITVINSALELNIQYKDELITVLKKNYAERPTLTASLIQKYIELRIENGLGSK
ncbi:MAG: hypothetical protein ACJAUP_003453 [Cellvibrionaceae bacterium]|jgi:hypothetical protein